MSTTTTPVIAIKHGPHIHVKPRHTLSMSSGEEAHREGERILKRIAAKQIDFQDSSVKLAAGSDSVIHNIGVCLKDYFELELVVVGHVGVKEADANRKSEEELIALSQSRAEGCMRRIYQLAEVTFLQAQGRGCSNGYDRGVVTFEPLKCDLLNPQARLDLVVQRCGWGFPPGKAEVSSRGRKTAAIMAQVLQDTPNCRVAISLPRTASQLATVRGQGIAKALKEAGKQLNVVVRTSHLREERATVTIEAGMQQFEDEKEPHEQILEILRDTPLGFLPNSCDLAPDVLPVLRRCAAVLKRVKDKTCVVEAYTGKSRNGGDHRLLDVMVARAQSIVNHLKAEGVHIPCRAEGHVGPYPGAPESKRPAVVITLDDGSDDEELVTEAEDVGGHVCCI